MTKKAFCCSGFLLSPVEVDGAHNALTLFYVDQLIRLEVFHRIHLAAGPVNLQQIHFFSLAEAEMNSQIVLRNVAAAAADFVDLLMWFGLIRWVGYTFQTRPDAAAIGFGSDCPNFDPVVF